VSDRYLVLAQRLGAQRDQLLAEVERLRADVQRLDSLRVLLESDRAAANALLDKSYRALTSPCDRLRADIRAHLAAQPPVKA
jgi:hypothetical protein